MYYPDTLIEEVRSRSDIVAVIGTRVKLTKKGANYFGCCPFHNEKTPSFSVSPAKQMYYCFGCGAGGNVVSFLMQYESYSFPEALEHLAERAGITLPKREMTQEEKTRESLRNRLLEMNTEAAKYFYYMLRQPVGKEGMAYFTRRGLTEETLRRFGLGYAPKLWDNLYRYLRSKGYRDEEIKASALVKFREDKGPMDFFRDRVMFPIMDKNSRVIGFGGRVLDKSEPKYLNSLETPLFDKGRNLYGLNYARQTRRPYYLVMEGYMDVIALHQAGIDCAVASLGTALTVGHAMLLKRYTDQVVLTYDSDGAGVKAAMRAIPIFRQVGMNLKVLDMRPYKDPDEFITHEGAAAFEERIAGARNFFLYQADVWKTGFDMADPAGRTAYQKKLAEELTGFEDPAERENYLEEVCREQHIKPELLRGLMNRVGNRRVTSELPAEPEMTEEDPGMAASAVKGEKDEGLLVAQQMLLAWAVSAPITPQRLGQLVEATDFSLSLYRELWEKILKDKPGAGELLPASLLTQFLEHEEEGKLVAAVFSRSLSQSLPAEERARVLTENLRRLRRQRLNASLREAVVPAEVQRLAVNLAHLQEVRISPEEV